MMLSAAQPASASPVAAASPGDSSASSDDGFERALERGKASKAGSPRERLNRGHEATRAAPREAGPRAAEARGQAAPAGAAEVGREAAPADEKSALPTGPADQRDAPAPPQTAAERLASSLAWQRLAPKEPAQPVRAEERGSDLRERRVETEAAATAAGKAPVPGDAGLPEPDAAASAPRRPASPDRDTPDRATPDRGAPDRANPDRLGMEGKVTVVAQQAAPAPVGQTTLRLAQALAPLVAPGRHAADEAAPATAPGSQRLQIQLHPRELGTVNASLRVSGAELAIEIRVETAAAYRQLSDDSDALLKSLRGMGYEISQVTILQPQIAVPAATAGDQTGTATGQNLASGGQAQHSGSGRGGQENGQAGAGRGYSGEIDVARLERDAGPRGGDLYI